MNTMEERKRRAIELRQQRVPVKLIARELKVSPATVRNYLYKRAAGQGEEN